MIFADLTLTVQDVIVTLIGLIILWIIVSIPVWLAGKAVTGGRATFGEAMVATLVGPIIFILVALIIDFFFGALGIVGFAFGFILALIAWIWVFKASFRTGWLQAVLIAILAWVIFIILSIIIGVIFGTVFPSPFFPKI